MSAMVHAVGATRRNKRSTTRLAVASSASSGTVTAVASRGLIAKNERNAARVVPSLGVGQEPKELQRTRERPVEKHQGNHEQGGTRPDQNELLPDGSAQ